MVLASFVLLHHRRIWQFEGYLLINGQKGSGSVTQLEDRYA